MSLPRAKPAYDQDDENRTRQAIDDGFAKSYRRGQSIELFPNTSVVMRSPDGTRWKLAISNAGALSAVLA